MIGKKKMLITAFATLVNTAAVAGDTYTQGYVRQNGTYVQPHHRSTPNQSRTDNYSSKGNINPYTGQQGHVDPYKPPSTNPYNYPRGNQKKQNW